MRRTALAVISVLACVVNTAGAQGLMFPSTGPIGRSFGGATTAAPLDASTALMWNPAAIDAVTGNELAVGAEMLVAETHLSSTLPAGAAGGGLPTTTRSGTTRSDSGLSTLPTAATVFRPWGDESPWTFGLALVAAVNSDVNFSGGGNPVLSPTNPPGGGRTPPAAFGLGPQVASATVITFTPTASYRVNEWLAVGAGPMLASMTIALDPAFFALPDDVNGDGVSHFPTANDGRPHWGAGFQVGALAYLTDEIDFGVSYKSPLWFETLVFESYDELRNPRQLRLPFTIPQIISMGLAYKGIPRTTIAADLRWLDYRTTKTLGESPDEGGVGWNSVLAFSLGMQYQLNQRTTVRLGYTVNENPVPEVGTLFNTQLPGIVQHTLGAGATIEVSATLTVSLAYVHGFESSVAGPVREVPGAAVEIDSEYDSFLVGANVKF